MNNEDHKAPKTFLRKELDNWSNEFLAVANLFRACVDRGDFTHEEYEIIQDFLSRENHEFFASKLAGFNWGQRRITMIESGEYDVPQDRGA